MSWRYNENEVDVLWTDGVPTSASRKPALAIDRLTGNVWTNLGGGTTWTVGSRLASGSYETVTGAERVLTSADNGMVFFCSRAGGIAFTLPANATVGFRVLFVIKTAPTTAVTVTAATADTIIGYPVASSGGDETANGNAAGDVLNFVANTALPSDSAEFVSDGTSWHVRAVCKATGAITITG